MKTAAEGADRLDLRGAHKTTEHLRPLLFVEGSGGNLGRETAEFTQDGVLGGDVVAPSG